MLIAVLTIIALVISIGANGYIIAHYRGDMAYYAEIIAWADSIERD